LGVETWRKRAPRVVPGDGPARPGKNKRMKRQELENGEKDKSEARSIFVVRDAGARREGDGGAAEKRSDSGRREAQRSGRGKARQAQSIIV
jgi:hypothetical protein